MRLPLAPVLLASLASACAPGPSAQRPALAPPAAPAKTFKMRTYYMGFLRRGPTWSYEKTAESRALGAGHMANINRLGACGKLLIAGPFEQPKDADAHGPLAGIFLFDVATREEAEALMRTDPAIAAGRFTMEVLPWYGPAGLTYDGHQPVAPGTPCAPPPAAP